MLVTSSWKAIPTTGSPAATSDPHCHGEDVFNYVSVWTGTATFDDRACNGTDISVKMVILIRAKDCPVSSLKELHAILDAGQSRQSL